MKYSLILDYTLIQPKIEEDLQDEGTQDEGIGTCLIIFLGLSLYRPIHNGYLKYPFD